MECLRLRVKDLDVDYRTVTVRDGKGEKDRMTILPDSLIAPLQEHLRQVKALHDRDLAQGYGAVYLPDALERKYPNAHREWGWQYLFPSNRLSVVDPRSLSSPSGRRAGGEGIIRRHHLLDESGLQKAIRQAAQRAGIPKPVSPTPCATPSPLTSWRPAMTSARESAAPPARQPRPDTAKSGLGLVLLRFVAPLQAPAEPSTPSQPLHTRCGALFCFEYLAGRRQCWTGSGPKPP